MLLALTGNLSQAIQTHNNSFWILLISGPWCRLFLITYACTNVFYCFTVVPASLVTQVIKNLPAIQKTLVRSLNWEEPLEYEMATHLSILAWEIPWTEQSGRLQSMGSQRVRHDWATNTLFTFIVVPGLDVGDGNNTQNYFIIFRSKWRAQVRNFGGSLVKKPPASVGDTSLIPGSGRSPREENGNPFQYSCLGNPMDRGARLPSMESQKSQIWLSN